MFPRVIHRRTELAGIRFCEEQLERYQFEGNAFLDKIIAGDETSYRHCKAERAKERLVQALVFSVATYNSESWTITSLLEKKFDVIPWTARRTSILSQLSISEDDRLLRHVQRNCLRFFGHIARRRGIEYAILTGITSGRPILDARRYASWTN
ncbi:hypothetical protein LAZ67_5001930 [Cordylochernes scorpioides]|uniref:Transposase n=1 Tax=Cordylochernes scorpioides TaxID=51811 RepID=A0ABY6KG11_9ARAC|nr:hypothetical protein LAZ67_5001930 [Cordylochernes scorpioides]